MQKIYQGLAGGERASSVTFVQVNQSTSQQRFVYGSAFSGSSSSIQNANLTNIQFYPSTYTHRSSYQNKYSAAFPITFTKTKTPVKLEIGNNSYNLSIPASISITSHITFFSDLVSNSADRVSASNLTKSIQFELVDNEQVTFTDLTNRFESGNVNGLFFTFGLNAGVISIESTGNRENGYFVVIPSTITKTPTHYVVNGREFSAEVVSISGGRRVVRSISIPDTNFRISSSNLGPWGINIKFSDGTYLNNTRSKLFHTPTKQLVWKNTDPPEILTFTVTPTTIDLDTRPTGNVTLTWTATAQTGKTLTSNTYLEPQGTQFGQTYTTAAGVGVSETFTYTQPNQTQNYRLVIRNNSGASHKDASVAITQNPVVSDLAVAFTGDRQGGTGGTIRITGRVKGFPRPEITVSPGWTYPAGLTHISARHFTPVSGVTNTWAFTTTQYHGTNPGAVTYTVTGTNSSGSHSAQITLR